MPEDNKKVSTETLITLLGLLGGCVSLVLGYKVEMTYSGLIGKITEILAILVIIFFVSKIILEGVISLMESKLSEEKVNTDHKTPS